MKTLKKVAFDLIEVEFIPEANLMESGKIYYSKAYNTTNHLCPCGCGTQTPLPIKDGEWSLSVDNGKVTINPSILHRAYCKSHYVITNGSANILNEPIPKSEWYDRDTHAPGACPM